VKVHISISLDPAESAALADQHDATLATVKDSEGNTHTLCMTRGAIIVPCNDRPVTITPRITKEKKGLIASLRESIKG
jgi:hypothetical protein